MNTIIDFHTQSAICQDLMDIVHETLNFDIVCSCEFHPLDSIHPSEDNDYLCICMICITTCRLLNYCFYYNIYDLNF